MKQLTILILCLFLTTIINAQSVEIDDSINPEWRQSGDIQFGTYFGYTTNILSENTNFNDEDDFSGNSFLIGAQADYFLGKNWSLKARLNYEKRDFGNNIDVDYITVPLAVAWHFGKNRRWHLALGAAYNASIDSEMRSGFGTDLNIGVIIPISKLKFFIEIDGITQTDVLDITVTDSNGNPISNSSLNSNRSSLNIGILF